jgi:hypothetical protein
MNSVIVVLVMATMVALILIRTVRRDLSKYEQLLVEPGSIDPKVRGGVWTGCGRRGVRRGSVHAPPLRPA